MSWADSEYHQRYMQPVDSSSRRRCRCGCNKRARHLGMANGVALSTGCEMYIRRWVRDGAKASSVTRSHAHNGGESE